MANNQRATEIDEPRVGRPPGSNETPYRLVEVDLQQTLKLQRQLRNTLATQIKTLENQLETKGLPLDDRLEIVEALGKLHQILTTGIGQTAKWVLTGEGGKDDRSPEEVLAMLESGT